MSREPFLKCRKKSGSKEERTVLGVNEEHGSCGHFFISVRLERWVWKVKPKWLVGDHFSE